VGPGTGAGDGGGAGVGAAAGVGGGGRSRVCSDGEKVRRREKTGVGATDRPAAAFLAAARTSDGRSGDGEVGGGRAEGGGAVVGAAPPESPLGSDAGDLSFLSFWPSRPRVVLPWLAEIIFVSVIVTAPSRSSFDQ